MKINRVPRTVEERRIFRNVWVGSALLGITFWITVIWVAVHFISKWW